MKSCLIWNQRLPSETLMVIVSDNSKVSQNDLKTPGYDSILNKKKFLHSQFWWPPLLTHVYTCTYLCSISTLYVLSVIPDYYSAVGVTI